MQVKLEGYAIPCETCHVIVPIGTNIEMGKFLMRIVELPGHAKHDLNIYALLSLSVLRELDPYRDYPVEGEKVSDKIGK